MQNPPPPGGPGPFGAMGVWSAPVTYQVFGRHRALYSVRGGKYGAVCPPRQGIPTALFDACAVRAAALGAQPGPAVMLRRRPGPARGCPGPVSACSGPSQTPLRHRPAAPPLLAGALSARGADSPAPASAGGPHRPQRARGLSRADGVVRQRAPGAPPPLRVPPAAPPTPPPRSAALSRAAAPPPRRSEPPSGAASSPSRSK